jgi:hypothetical protein
MGTAHQGVDEASPCPDGRHLMADTVLLLLAAGSICRSSFRFASFPVDQAVLLAGGPLLMFDQLHTN